MKKIASVFLFFAIIISLFASMCLSASAVDEIDQYEVTMNPDYLYGDLIDTVYDDIFDFSKYYDNADTAETNNDFLVEIDISKHNISVDNVFTYFDTMFSQYPELFFLDGWMSASYYPDTGTVASIFFRTEYHIDDIPGMIEAFESAALPVIKEGSKLKTDLEKALFVHNYIVLNTKYNEEVIDGGDGQHSVYTAYGVLVDRDAVCQGYAYAFNYLIRRMGVVSDYVRSDEILHGWNLVNIGNYWYHLDATWDDPIYDVVGKIYYENFLRSEAGIIETEHTGMLDYQIINGTSTVYNVSDTRFDNLFLHNTASYRGNTAYHNGKWYFIKYEGGNAYICSTSDIFVSESNLKYEVVKECGPAYDRPGLYIYEDRMFFTKKTGIYSCDFNGANEIAVFEPTVPSGKKVFGLAIREGRIYYNIEASFSGADYESHPYIYSYTLPVLTPKSSATFSADDSMIWDISYGTTAKQITSMFNEECYIVNEFGVQITDDTVLGTGYKVKAKVADGAYSPCVTVVITGDANGDAKLNGKDIIRIKKYLLNMETDVIYSLCGDLNGDGIVNDADISALVSAISN